jgi:hypothetical protein
MSGEVPGYVTKQELYEIYRALSDAENEKVT